jgi:DNA-binding NtrC family response regulator
MGSDRLNPGERAFLERVAQAVFTNPFGPEREALDRAILGRRPGPDRYAALCARVGRALAPLEEEGRADLARFAGADRETLAYAFLFELYHRHTEELDRHVAAQERAGGDPVEADFAAGVLAALRGRGFRAAEARRSLELFFQLRRAFTFIDRALVGSSACMQALRQALWNGIFTRDIRLYEAHLWNRMEDFSTLLLGETGTGKGSAAAALGRSGFVPFDERKGRFAESFTRAFVSLNLSQFPEALLESELFGHRKGAFTGAVEDHLGVFASCSPHGAIFLDEIGEVSGQVQIKLLQVLQERTFTPVGSRETRRFRGRVVGATNRTLAELRPGPGAPGGFRDDFYYRLCSDVIVVPPLRQRLAEAPGELELLVVHVLERRLGLEAPELVDRVCATIETDLGPGYPWPGNVRELEQRVRRILLTGGCADDAAGSPASAAARSADPFLAAVAEGRLDARALLAGYCARLHARLGSYEAVARHTRLDRRTVKRHVELARERDRG